MNNITDLNSNKYVPGAVFVALADVIVNVDTNLLTIEDESISKVTDIEMDNNKNVEIIENIESVEIKKKNNFNKVRKQLQALGAAGDADALRKLAERREAERLYRRKYRQQQRLKQEASVLECLRVSCDTNIDINGNISSTDSSNNSSSSGGNMDTSNHITSSTNPYPNPYPITTPITTHILNNITDASIPVTGISNGVPSKIFEYPNTNAYANNTNNINNTNANVNSNAINTIHNHTNNTNANVNVNNIGSIDESCVDIGHIRAASANTTTITNTITNKITNPTTLLPDWLCCREPRRSASHRTGARLTRPSRKTAKHYEKWQTPARIYQIAPLSLLSLARRWSRLLPLRHRPLRLASGGPRKELVVSDPRHLPDS